MDPEQFAYADFLRSIEHALPFLQNSMVGNDASLIAGALADVVCANGLEQIAARADVSPEILREELLLQGNPTLKTFTSVFGAIGLEVSVQRKSK